MSNNTDDSRFMNYELNSSSPSIKEEVELLRKQNFELVLLLEEYGINYKEARIISDVEWICRSEISKLKTISENSTLSDTDVDNLEKLTKVLSRETNKSNRTSTKTPKGKKLDSTDLIDIVNSDESSD